MLELLGEVLAASGDVGDVCEGFPDEVTQVGRDMEVGKKRLEDVPVLEGGTPVGIGLVEGASVVGRLGELA